MMDEKTLFDGRLHFHKEASDIRMKYYACVFAKDYNGWISCLDMFYGLTCSYMNKDSAEIINKKIQVAYQKVMMIQNARRNSFVNNFYLEKELATIFKEIMMATKKMWLPIEELNSEWDTNAFMNGTG